MQWITMLSWKLAVWCLLVAGAFPAQAQVPGPPDGSRRGTPLALAIDGIFSAEARPDSPGCAAGVYRGGKIEFAKGYGMASIEHARPITPQTLFNIASLSKQFTAYAVQLLADRGRLTLEDDIHRHLPDFPEVGAVVRVKHLLHHTSGLRAYEALHTLLGWNRDHPLSREQALDVIHRHRTTGFPPGERHEYGNTNYVLLAQIVEKVSGRPLERFLEDEVFKPFGMRNTRLRIDPLAVIPGRADTYWRNKDGGVRRNHIWAFAHATGASNVITNLEDLARWDAAFYGDRLGKGLVERMQTPGRLTSGEMIEYASGLYVSMHRGRRVVGHSGGAGGDYALFRFPDLQLTSAVLCNFEGPDAGGRALAIIEKFAPDAFAAEVRSESTGLTLQDSELKQFIGEYRHPTDPERRLHIEVRDGVLGALVAGTFFPAVASGPRSFRVEPMTFTFSEPAPGSPVRLAYVATGGPDQGTLLRWSPPNWRPPARELERYAGTYHSAELDVSWTFFVRDGRLVVRRPRFRDRPVTAEAMDTFKLEIPFEEFTWPVQLTFTRDGERVVGMVADTQRAKSLRFKRSSP